MFNKILQLPQRLGAWWFTTTPKSTKPISPPQPPKAPWVKKFADEEEERRRYTYDMPTITRRPWHWLFVPDEMQYGMYRHHLIEDHCERYNAFGFTQQKMLMLNNGTGNFIHPLVFDTDLGYQHPDVMLPVKGEIYKNVPPGLLVDLDQFRSNGIFYIRRLVSIVVPFDRVAFKDRTAVENIVGRVSRTHKTTVAYFRKRGYVAFSNGTSKTLVPAEAAELARDTQVNSANIPFEGVMQEMMWMYLANPLHWVDHIDRTNVNKPVTSYINEKGLIKEYYRFTDAEVPPF